MVRKRGPKGQFVRKTPSKKTQVLAKTKRMSKPTLSSLQKDYETKARRRKAKIPTRTINMHGSLYTLYDTTPRNKIQAQTVRKKLKAKGMAAFLNPRKRKDGTDWFVYKKQRSRVAKAPQVKVSKRSGIPTQSINMHGKSYSIYDNTPRTKAQAQKIRTALTKKGFSAFLNPRRRKSGTEYFIYKKKAERVKSSPKKSSTRKPASKKSRDKVIDDLEAQLRRLKAQD